MGARSRLEIPLREIRFRFARSSGAGGQNVNKTNTKAALHWPVTRSTSLPAAVRERFVARFRRRINTEGELVLSSQRFRDRSRNIADCIEKLHAMLAEVEHPRAPRRPTRVPRRATEGRLRAKRERGETKHLRRRPDGEAL